jgi:3-oxoacyl-[acyl-carrier-protein] synthase II
MTTLLEAGLASTKLRNAKTTTRDRHDRPIVVVTGMGVITSLAEGKTENWTKIIAGESGIRTIRRFATHGLTTRIAGTIDFVEVKPFSSTTLAERLADIVIEEAIGQSEIGRKGDFPGPLFLGLAPVEVEWPQREEIARASREAGSIDYDILLRASGGGHFTQVHARYQFGSVADHLCETFGTKGSPISVSTACASVATAIQLGVEAIRRGETDAALCSRNRRFRQCRGNGAIFPPVGAIYSQRRPARRIEAFFAEPARIRDG